MDKFEFDVNYKTWPEWLKMAWGKKPSLPGSLYPRVSGGVLRYFLNELEGEVEIRPGDIIVYNGVEIKKESAPSEPQ